MKARLYQPQPGPWFIGIQIRNDQGHSVFRCVNTTEYVTPPSFFRSTKGLDAFRCPVCRHWHFYPVPPWSNPTPPEPRPAPPVPDDDKPKPSPWERLARAIISALR